MRLYRSLLIVLGCALVWGIPAAVAQHEEDPHAAETKAQVPALNAFHTTIYKLWHTAWPKKDVDMMASLVPAIEHGVAELGKAELPGILRDKKAVWQENVKKLEEIAAAYVSAMAGTEAQPKLDAAEKLHMQYERLVRIVRPVLNEIDAFHTVLYMIYHYYMPEAEIEKIASAAGQLRAKMDTLNAVQLPERLSKRKEAFLAAREKLSASVDMVIQTVPSNDMSRITHAINAMHGDYEALEKVFE